MFSMIIHDSQKSENFGNLLSDFYNKAMYSDLVLHIGDTGNPGKTPFVIHTHQLVLHSASEYIRRRLSSCFLEDPSRSYVNNQLQITIQLDYARSGLDDEVVGLFFSLFYVARFDEAHLKANHLEERLHHNILVLYDLALYFLFDSLSTYIEQYFKATMCLAYFTPLSLFCLQHNPATATYSVEKQRGSTLYRRLAQWYACCVSGDEEAGAANTVDEEKETRCDSQYFSRNKQTILHEMAQIENCRLPKKEARRLNDSTIRLDYHRNLCGDCMGNSSNAVGAFYYLDMGCLTLKYTNGVERFFLRLKKKRRHDVRGVVYDNGMELTMISAMSSPPPYKKLRIASHGQQQRWMSPVDESDRYECESRISLLSRKRHKDKSTQSRSKKNIFIPTEINNFDVHAPKHCYEGRCDHCATLKPIYIMLISIKLSKESNSNNSPLEDMSMIVEEPTVQ